ncbi:MAG: DnaJ domain-containing protein [Spirochaetes bacterium]|nr:DnaJ domain-containing protein [Spirochaetota bacterium]
MGKIVGLLIGMFFGPLGAILGFIIGLFYDTTSKLKFDFQFNNFENSEKNQMIAEAFPVLAAKVVLSANFLDKQMVLAVKELMIDLFGYDKAKHLMHDFKNNIEKRVSDYSVEEVCTRLNQVLFAGEKQRLVMILLQIVKQKGQVGQQEFQGVIKIASFLGLNINPFAQFDFNQSGSYQYHSRYYQQQQHSSNQIDPYQVLDLTTNATNDEIKKKYRQLSMKYHPDKAASQSEDIKNQYETKMRQINDAYDQLKKIRNIK